MCDGSSAAKQLFLMKRAYADRGQQYCGSDGRQLGDIFQVKLIMFVT